MDVTGIRTTTAGMQRLLLVAAGLVSMAGLTLFLRSEDTHRYFAWRIASPLTASSLGAAYWAALFLEILCAREKVWARARIATAGVLVFTALTLVATLIHIDRFQFDSPELPAQVAAWAWLAIYIFVPLVMVGLLVVQFRQPGTDPMRELPVPSVGLMVLATWAGVFLCLGTVLFVAPSQAHRLWAWPLTPLTSRAVGAWLVGIGVGSVHAMWERDLIRLRPGLLAIFVLGVLEFVALARYGDEVDWASAAAWLYVAALGSFIAASLYGLLKIARQPDA